MHRRLRRVALVLALASTACAYHAPTAPTPPAPDLTTPATLTLAATPGQGPAAETARVTATVLNVQAAPLADVTVAFTTDAGVIPDAAVTDAAGVAQVLLTGAPGPARVLARVGALTTTALVALQPKPSAPPPLQPPPPPPPPPPGPAPLTVTLIAQPGVAGTATSFALSMSGGILRQATWTFGDATASVLTLTASTTHVYATAGPYTASVQIADALGRTASSQIALTIQAPDLPPAPAPPTLNAALACTPAPHGSASACNVTTTYGSRLVPSTAVTRVDWDWGDGSATANGGVVSTHSYGDAGTYTVGVTVTATTPDGPKTTTTTKAIAVL